MPTKRTGRQAIHKAAKRLLRAVDRSVAVANEIRQARDDLDRAIRSTDETNQPAGQAPASTGGSP